MQSISTLPPTARLALQALTQATTPLSIVDIAVATGSTPSTLIRTLHQLCRANQISRVKVGNRAFYEAAPEKDDSMPTDYYLFKSDGPANHGILLLALRDSHVVDGVQRDLLEAIILRGQINTAHTESKCHVGYFRLHLDTQKHEDTLRKAAAVLETPIPGKRDWLLKRERSYNWVNGWTVNIPEIWRLARIAHASDEKLMADHSDPLKAESVADEPELDLDEQAVLSSLDSPPVGDVKPKPQPTPAPLTSPDPDPQTVALTIKRSDATHSLRNRIYKMFGRAIPPIDQEDDPSFDTMWRVIGTAARDAENIPTAIETVTRAVEFALTDPDPFWRNNMGRPNVCPVTAFAKNYAEIERQLLLKDAKQSPIPDPKTVTPAEDEVPDYTDDDGYVEPDEDDRPEDPALPEPNYDYPDND